MIRRPSPGVAPVGTSEAGRQTGRRGVRGFGVTPSPLNAVKLELAVVLCGAVPVWLLQAAVTSHAGLQVLLLATYGAAGLGWILWRARRILRTAAGNEG